MHKMPIWYGWNTIPTLPETPRVPVRHSHHFLFLPVSAADEARTTGPSELPRYSATTLISPTILRLSSSRSSAGIQYS
jgi:hypothetical protein